MPRTLVLAWLMSVATAAAEAPPPAQVERIKTLCQQLGETQYGNMGAHQQLVEIGEPAMPYLLEALKDKRPQARWWAVAAVCKIATDEGYQAALDVLSNDPNSFVRSTAIFHLGHFLNKGKDVWPVAEQHLVGKDEEVGRWALELMVRRGYPKLDDALRRVLTQGGTSLRSYALGHVRSMCKSGDDGERKRAKALLPLVKQLLSPETPARLRYDAIHTTVVLMDGGQLDFLRQTYERDKDPIVRGCVLRCITVIPEPPVEAFELFIQGMREEDVKVREAASKLLRKAYKQYFGYDAKQPLPIREAAIEKWEKWYLRNRRRLQWHTDLRKFLLPGQREGKPADGAPRATQPGS